MRRPVHWRPMSDPNPKDRVARVFKSPERREDLGPTRARLHEIIFEADTPAGKAFDVMLLWLIVISVLVVSLESVQSYREAWGFQLQVVEWIVTVFFTLEYLVRLWVVRRPMGYALSFFGIVDLAAVIPTWLSLFVGGAQALAVVRVLRVLRFFRLLELHQFVGEAEILVRAITDSARKITVFLGFVLTVVIIMGSMMYLIEGASSGFDSIPRSIYWAIVTLTTVGYGDIAPQTPPGQFIAAVIMILGYSIIAVPTGVTAAEYALNSVPRTNTQSCPDCAREGHRHDSSFCRFCGGSLDLS